MQNIYCLSGLGADSRIFQRLQLPGAKLIPVNWAAYDAHDDMPCYAQKLSATIPEEHPFLLGVSFGGMLAVEIAKQRPVRKAILVSSAKTIDELPPVGTFLQFVGRHRLVPVGLFKHFHRQMEERFGTKTEEEKQLLRSILQDTDNGFVKWSMKALMDWQNHTIPDTVVHIHGTADQLIPPDRIAANYWIKGGTHFMVYNRADEVSKIITKYL